jgi:hypothetical protein
VTGDDFMPWEHRDLIARLHPTIATIDGEWEYLSQNHGVENTQEGFRRETVHRWAHMMIQQTAGTVIRYSPWNKGTWKVRKQHVKRTPTGTDAGDAPSEGEAGEDSGPKAQRVGPRTRQSRLEL